MHHDLRFALRTLARRRAFAVTATLTIALGIAATTSIYGIVNAVLLRPLPYRQSGQLVQVRQIFPKWRNNPVLDYMWDKIPLGVDEFERLRDRNTSFQNVGIWGRSSRLLTGSGAPARARLVLASASLLPTLGIRPIRGRGIGPGEDLLGGPKVVVIGFEEWKQRFGGNEGVLGKTIELDDVPFQIVGVLPEGFRLELRDSPIDYMVPVGQSENDRGHGNRNYSAVARLKPGVTMARAELETRQLLDDAKIPKTARLADWHVEQTRTSRSQLFILLGAAGLLLMIACVNVATLMLGEAASRETEIAARIALGAGRLRLVRQLLTEALVIAVIGCALGALVSHWGTKALVAIAPPRIPGLDLVHVDWRVLGFAIGVSLFTGIVFGLAPAMTLSGMAPGSLLRGGGQSVAGRGRLQFSFIAVQIALSVVLLSGAGLLGESLMRLSAVDPGFRSDHMLIVPVSAPRSIGADTLRMANLHRDAAARFAALPGVTAVAASTIIPFGGGSSSSGIQIVGRVLPPGERGPEVQERTVSPNFFDFMGIPVVAGRALSETDRGGTEPVVVVNEAMVRRDFPDGHFIGARVKFQGVERTIVGVASDVRFRSLSTNPEPTVYAPAAQRGASGSFLLRTSLPPAHLGPAVRRAIVAIDSRLTVGQLDTMDELVRQSFAEERFRTALVSLFGVMAAALAAVGMYGVAARAAARRTRELGIRVALGASASNVIGLIVRSTLGGVAVGIIAGLAAALVGARWAQSLLYQVDARNPVIYGAIVLLLGSVALAASVIPARRASRVHPSVALRLD
jgi:putative ABC transport system permease protein